MFNVFLAFSLLFFLQVYELIALALTNLGECIMSYISVVPPNLDATYASGGSRN